MGLVCSGTVLMGGWKVNRGADEATQVLIRQL